MFDTHCHLNFKRLEENVDQVIADAKVVGVTQMVVPGTDIESSQKAVQIAQTHDGIYAAVGIHPHHAYEYVEQKMKNVEQDIGELEKLLQPSSSFYSLHSTSPIVAIGEIGLDRHEYKQTKYQSYRVDEAFMTAQKELFVSQLALAKKYGLSVIIHNREAKADILPLITENWSDNLAGKAVFHCCEPDSELLQFAKEHQMFIGVDGDVTWGKSFDSAQDKAEFIKTVPLEMLVLETDAPFLLPRLPSPAAQANGGQAEPLKRPNVPANLPLIAQFVADLKGESVEKIAEQTTQNAQKLFNLQN